MDGLISKTLLKWMKWFGGTIIFGNTHLCARVKGPFCWVYKPTIGWMTIPYFVGKQSELKPRHICCKWTQFVKNTLLISSESASATRASAEAKPRLKHLWRSEIPTACCCDRSFLITMCVIFQHHKFVSLSSLSLSALSPWQIIIIMILIGS